MGKMLERKCRNCGNVYKFESSDSFIVFCPYCKRFDYLESEYISPVTECTVFMGDEIIGAVKAYSDDNCEYDDDVAYDISVPVIGISDTLKTKDDPLIDAVNVISEKLSKKYGFMDIRNGKIILLGERLGRGYTFRQFKKSPMYCGQSSERYITLNKAYRINEKEFYISLFFRHGLLYLISLVCDDISLSPHEEPKRKELHDKILSEYGLSDYEQYIWGSVSSVYDAKANVSSINIVFKYEEGELPLFYNSNNVNNVNSNNTDNKTLPDNKSESICLDYRDVDDNKPMVLHKYLMKMIKCNDSALYKIIDTEEPYNDNQYRSFKKEYEYFYKRLNYANKRDEESERFFLFLHNNGFSIRTLVSKKQGKEYLFSQLKYALELEDTYYNKYLLPPFNEWLCDNVKPDEHEVAIGDFKRINGLSGELTNLDWFMSFFVRQWEQFIEYLYKTVEQVVDNICVKVSFPEAVTKEKKYIQNYREAYKNEKQMELQYDGTNKNLYKNLFIYCLISYLDDFYLSKFPDISDQTFLEDYYLATESDINDGLDLSCYALRDIPDLSDMPFPDLTPLKNVMPKKRYSLGDVAEVYAKVSSENKEKIYKRLQRFFLDTNIFVPSKESGEYEFDDIILPVAAHLYYKKKNRKYDPDNNECLSDNRIFASAYYPLFKGKVFGRDELIKAYTEYRSCIITEFKLVLEEVDDQQLISFINYIVGKSSMRLNMRICGLNDDLIDSI